VIGGQEQRIESQGGWRDARILLLYSTFLARTVCTLARSGREVVG
jgi:hypothetical protein